MILGTAPDIEMVADCSGAEAVETVLGCAADVVLLDIRMPDVDGLTVLRRLRAVPEPPTVAMLTTFDAQEYLTAALREGAAGFLLKDSDPEQLVRAVRTLAEGGSVLDPGVTRAVIGGYLTAEDQASAARAVRGLTPRESEVLALLGEGLANAQIAWPDGARPQYGQGPCTRPVGQVGRDQPHPGGHRRRPRRPGHGRSPGAW